MLRRNKHVHYWTIIGMTYSRNILKEREYWGTEYIVTKDEPVTIYALQCDGCGDVSSRTVAGHMKPVEETDASV